MAARTFDDVASRRYRFLGDSEEIVEDTETGLQWMRCTLGQTWNGSACVGEYLRFTWREAIKMEETFNRLVGYGGYRDWRVPLADELDTLLFCSSGKPRVFPRGEYELSQNNESVCQGNHKKPLISEYAFPNNPVERYWTRTIGEGGQDEATVLYFDSGSFEYEPRSWDHLLRMVRGGKRTFGGREDLLGGRYYLVEPRNDIVIDFTTGIFWGRCSIGQTWDGAQCKGRPGIFTLQEARAEIAKLNTSGALGPYRDWRLPTASDLSTLIFCSSGEPSFFREKRNKYDRGVQRCRGYEYQKPTIFAEAFPGTGKTYWSSTPDDFSAVTAKTDVIGVCFEMGAFVALWGDFDSVRASVRPMRTVSKVTVADERGLPCFR